MIDPIAEIFSTFFTQLMRFLPQFLGGVALLVIGIIFAGIVHRFFGALIRFFRIPQLMARTKLVQENEAQVWAQVIGEIIRWTIIILFLIPTLEAWQLPQATVVLNELLLYIPNVIVAVVIVFIGMVASNLIANLVRQSIQSLGNHSAESFALFARSVVIFFTILIVLSQLGVAQELISTLFTGIVAMIALAGGLAFGLGGKDVAKRILEKAAASVEQTAKERGIGSKKTTNPHEKTEVKQTNA